MADLGSVNNYFNQSDQNSIFRMDGLMNRLSWIIKIHFSI